jgi:sensor histidine kinase regulating citrate/malate metabolism
VRNWINWKTCCECSCPGTSSCAWNRPRSRFPFFELFITTKGEGLGTGLGLATVKALVDGDLGAVRVQSSAAGCRFIITYPVATRVESPVQVG